jgi:hypothetical protein
MKKFCQIFLTQKSRIFSRNLLTNDDNYGIMVSMKERELEMSVLEMSRVPSVFELQEKFHKLNNFTVRTWLRVAQQHLPTLEGDDREAIENGIRAAAGVLRLRYKNWE